MKVLTLFLGALSLSTLSCKTAPEEILLKSFVTVSYNEEVLTESGGFGLAPVIGGGYLFPLGKGWAFTPGISMGYDFGLNYGEPLNLFRLRPYFHFEKYFDLERYSGNPIFVLWCFYIGAGGIFATHDFSELVLGVSPSIGFKIIFLGLVPGQMRVRYDFYTDPKYNRLGIEAVITIPLYLITLYIKGGG